MNKLKVSFIIIIIASFLKLSAQTNHDSIYLFIEPEYNSDTINVNVRIINGYGLSSAQFFINLDKSLYKVLESKAYDYKSTGIEGAIVGPASDSNFIGYIWYHPNGKTGSIPDGEIILSFKLLTFNPLVETCFQFRDKSTGRPIEFVNDAFVALPARGIPSCETFPYAIIEGKINLDLFNNCIEDVGEISLPRFNLNFHNANYSYETQTNKNGDYRKVVSPGLYDVNILPPNSNWDLCTSTPSISVTELKKKYNYSAQAKIKNLCPQMEVNIIANRLRLCFENNLIIQYNNLGTIEASDVYILLQLDNRITIHNSSLPYINLGNNQYRFEIGNVEIFQPGNINLVIGSTCDIEELNNTVCIEVNIFPNIPCDINPLWSGADLKIHSSCVGDSVEFTVSNLGSGDMTSTLMYTIVEDDLIPGTQGILKLDKNESIIIKHPANGNTIRIITDTIAFHPYKTRFTDALEACNTNNQKESLGYINRFSLGDEAPFYDVACFQLVGSYDPNDKSASPVGIKSMNLISKDTRIQYKIRFQNTGTDTAFRVKIIDEISESLDLSSIIIEGSSHPLVWNFDEGRVLKFTFNNINLVDSITNEKESNGFVQYSIDPIKGIEEGTIIENKADIFFDFNPAIVTNTTTHTITTNFTLVNDDSKKEIWCNFYPVPSSDNINFELIEFRKSTKLIICDLFGREVYSEIFQNKKIKFDKINKLNKGSYFFKIVNKGKTMQSGKILIN
ncbi:MAG: T9SS type A sorting domain-containing protein [Saprospiraceae bacterium]